MTRYNVTARIDGLSSRVASDVSLIDARDAVAGNIDVLTLSLGVSLATDAMRPLERGERSRVIIDRGRSRVTVSRVRGAA